MVEFALVLPLLLLLMLAIFGYGLAFYHSLAVGNANREGLRVAVVGATPCQVYNEDVSLLSASGMTGTPTLAFTYTEASGDPQVCSIPSEGNCSPSPTLETGQWVTVALSYPATSVVPLPGLGSSYTIKNQATMMMEQPGASTLPASCP